MGNFCYIQNDIKIKLLVCLGNYEDRYRNTRHNAGFELCDYFLNKIGKHLIQKKSSYELITFEQIDLKILKPTELMNRSGNSLRDYLKYSPIKSDQIALAFDDLDLKLGSYKIQESKSPRSHNGVNSVESLNDVSRSIRIRIGIENRENKFLIPGADYVLGKFTEDERFKLDEVISNIWNEFEIKE